MSDQAARGRSHLALNRHKLGSWNTLSDFQPKDLNKNEEDETDAANVEPKDNGNTFVSRLDENFMGLYGLFPETDKFSAVVCDCGSIVKPQGFKNHLARNHSSTNGGLRGSSKSDSLIYSSYSASSSSNNGSSSRTRDKDNNYSSSNSPASSTSSTPVKNPEDFSGILPNIVVKHKHKHKSSSESSSKSKHKSKSSGLQHHSSDSQPSAEKQLPEFLMNATSTSLDSGTYTFSASKSASGGVTTTVTSSSNKSQSSASSKGRHRHSKHSSSSKKIEIYDPDRHCGVISHATEEGGGKPCVRSFSCKIHSVQQRREVQGRTRNYDALLLEMTREPEVISIDLESNSSSCSSSVMEKQPPEAILTEEATIRIKEQIELPTILLRKLEHDVVQGMDNRAIAELLEKNAIVVKKEEPIELQVMDTGSQNADQLPPQELFELISQVEDAGPNQNILTMEQLTNLVEETNKNQVDMYQEVQQLHTELHCRTIAFPLSVFYLMKNNSAGHAFVSSHQASLEPRSEIKFGNAAFQTLDSEQIGQYYDANQMQGFDLQDANTMHHHMHQGSFSSKPSHDLLSNILTLQELVPLVPDNYCDVYSKVCDQNLLSDCSNLFPMLTTAHDNDVHHDKQFDTDYRAIKSCMYPNLPKPATVNTFGLKRVGGGSTISRKALYLRKTLLKTKDSDKKFKLKTEGTNYATANVQSPHGMLLTSSAAVNKGRKRSFLASTAAAKQKTMDSNDMLTGGHRLTNSFTTNDTNKMDMDSNLDEILQPKRPLFVTRY